MVERRKQDRAEDEPSRTYVEQLQEAKRRQELIDRINEIDAIASAHWAELSRILRQQQREP